MVSTLSRGDFPPNPLKRPGYRLDFHDEFSGVVLDEDKWLPCYLPQWSSRARSAARYHLQDGLLSLLISADQQPWCPEFDGGNRCSSIQTGVFAGPLGSGAGQHRFNSACLVREPQDNVRTYTPRYGYFELRARAVKTPANHVALWMIGYEESPEESAEIAIMEIMGKDVHAEASHVRYGVHPWGDPAITDEFYEDPLPINATRFHLYAAEWAPARIDFYIDNRKLRTIHQSPRYPMQFMLGIYERPAQGTDPRDAPDVYPKSFVVDYFRAYQPMTGYPGQLDALQ